MLYAVRIDLARALTLPEEQLEILRSRERDMAAHLAEQGMLLRLWRLTDAPWGNIGLWRARDLDELGRTLDLLPLRPWMNITVEALMAHPSDPGVDDATPRSGSGGDA